MHDGIFLRCSELLLDFLADFVLMCHFCWALYIVSYLNHDEKILCYYINPYGSKLFEVIRKHSPSAHPFADDTQIYFSFKPEP